MTDSSYTAGSDVVRELQDIIADSCPAGLIDEDILMMKLVSYCTRLQHAAHNAGYQVAKKEHDA